MTKPQKGESHADYIRRCMGNSETNDKYPDKKQRNAICQGMWVTSKAIEWLKQENKTEEIKNKKKKKRK
jgi:hypothetical protein